MDIDLLSVLIKMSSTYSTKIQGGTNFCKMMAMLSTTYYIFIFGIFLNCLQEEKYSSHHSY